MVKREEKINHLSSLHMLPSQMQSKPQSKTWKTSYFSCSVFYLPFFYSSFAYVFPSVYNASPELGQLTHSFSFSALHSNVKSALQRLLMALGVGFCLPCPLTYNTSLFYSSHIVMLLNRTITLSIFPIKWWVLWGSNGVLFSWIPRTKTKNKQKNTKNPQNNKKNLWTMPDSWLLNYSNIYNNLKAVIIPVMWIKKLRFERVGHIIEKRQYWDYKIIKPSSKVLCLTPCIYIYLHILNSDTKSLSIILYSLIQDSSLITCTLLCLWDIVSVRC